MRDRAVRETDGRTGFEEVDDRGGGGEGDVRAERFRGDRVHRGWGHETGVE